MLDREMEEALRRSRPTRRQKRPEAESPITTSDIIEAKYGKQYFDCTVLELDGQTITVRWTDDSVSTVPRPAVRRKK